ncbi:leucine-rich repeat-containing protein 10B [Favolaschia claudopus]|uniref:Leucine-rich repeat-containing protein 10B n=1 Tax=Favolaschia claudopus TaxID=2862362 RepID=A0AAW0BZD5_9AGAR
MFDDHDAPWSSSSSPPSSPTAYVDSSPSPAPYHDEDASSDYGDVDSLRVSALQDPFAASAKSESWRVPDYEKGNKMRRQESPGSPSRVRSKKPRLLSPESSFGTLSSSPPLPRPTLPTKEDLEQDIWNRAIDRLYQVRNGTVDLSDSGVTSLSDHTIQELHGYFSLPDRGENLDSPSPAPLQFPSFSNFKRSYTAPAVLSRDRPGLQLHLSRCQISKLPIRFFALKQLTILVLRNNMLETLPPEISQLTNLLELNISGNQLAYLPSELFSMELINLWVFPGNKFIEKPDAEKSAVEPPAARSSSSNQLFPREKSRGRVAISDTVSTPSSRIPTLVELCFRVLFSTDVGAPTKRQILDSYYMLPLPDPDHIIPPLIRRTFHAIHRGSVVDHDTTLVEDEPPSLGVCPSPRHGDRQSVFLTPAEERFTWEAVVAGKEVGGYVPIRWRGCSSGCLDFLGGAEAGKKSPPLIQEELEVSDADPGGVVQQVQLNKDGFGEEDFDDDE